MKILVIMKKFSGGPKIFRQRLVDAFLKYAADEDIEIVHDPTKEFDGELCFLRHQVSHNKPIIIRVDGCYHGGDHEKMNEVYKNSINKSKYVIYQSDFSRKMCKGVMNIKKPDTVIHNGIDLDSIKNIQPDKEIPPGSFVACAIWRKNKRPFSMIKGFLKASVKNHLYIIGGHSKVDNKIERYKENKRIHFLGECTFERVISVFKACSYQIHLTQIDSCPNSIIEGLSCGLRILYTNLGGTREIVKDDGVILDIDKWDFHPLTIRCKDNINPSIVAKGIHKLISKDNGKRSDRSDLDIKYVVKKYVSVLRSEI
ncbi:MAG: glycosyltransferase family 4 protein [Candidatus Asgardarchaeia archaeon]